MIKINTMDIRFYKAYRNAKHLFKRFPNETAKENHDRWKKMYRCSKVSYSWLITDEYCIFDNKEDLEWFIDTFDRPYMSIVKGIERGSVYRQ